MRHLLVVLATLASSGLAATQSGAPGGPPTGVRQVARAAGMALPDGALPPGSLTVRIVQGAFSGNLADVEVTLDVSGEGPTAARTGADGRAAFAHLPVGARIRASATVNGERLESEPFTMPAEAGIRLLFVAGEGFVDTATAAGAAAIPPLAAEPGTAGSAPGPPAPGGTSASDVGAPDTAGGAPAGVQAFRVAMIALTALAFALVGYSRLKRR